MDEKRREKPKGVHIEEMLDGRGWDAEARIAFRRAVAIQKKKKKETRK